MDRDAQRLPTAGARAGARVRIVLASVVLLAACSAADAPASDPGSGVPGDAPPSAPPVASPPVSPPATAPSGPAALEPELLPGLEWTTDCTEDGSTRRVRLAPASDEGVSLLPLDVDGPTYEYLPPDVSDAGAGRITFTVDLSRVARITLDDALDDTLDGGRREALAVDTACWLGNGFASAIEVWAQDLDGAIVQLPSPLRYGKSDGYLVDLEGDGDALVLTMRVGAPGEPHPHLVGYPYVRVSEHRFDGVRWDMQVRSLAPVPQR